MPLTLYWYILRDIAKLLLTATAVLVVLLAMGVAIKPISEGMLGPMELMKVVGYTVPCMLPFALPFAAAFASTLVFFRLSQDNEITACSASGISYRELLMPIIAVGLVLTLGIFYLSNWVVPRFWKLAAMQIEQDIARLVVQQLRSGNVVDWEGMLLYADEAIDNVPIEPRTDVPTPYNRIVLKGVAVGRLDRNRTLRDNYSAEIAVVDFYRNQEQNRTFATMKLTGVTINDADSGTMVYGEHQNIEAQEIPTLFENDPKFLSLEELRALSETPQVSADVREAKTDVVQLLAEQAMLYGLSSELEKDGSAQLIGPRGQHYRLIAPMHTLKQHELVLSGRGAEGAGAADSETGKVQVLLEAGGIVTQRLEAESATIEVNAASLDDEPRITLKLQRVQVIDPALPTPSNQREVTLALLHSPKAVMAPLAAARPADLVELARRYELEELDDKADTLRERVTRLMREISARLHERAATAVNTVLVLVLGAVMSMFLRRQVPLAIFFWCFMPTVVSFLMISGGQHMISGNDAEAWAGIAMVWGGNAGLLALILVVYSKLARN